MVEKLSKNLIIVTAIIIAGVLIAGAVFYVNWAKEEKIAGFLTAQQAAEKTINFINQHLVEPGMVASLKNVVEEEGLYKITFELGGQEQEAYISKNATLLFPQVIDLREEPRAQVEPTEPQVSIDRDIEQLKTFAQCLSDKGVKFYGTYWCGFCTRQKEMFGEAAKYLPYIECASDRASPEELAMCEKAGVESIPDWRFADGRQELGMLSLEKLAEFSGCQL